MSLPVTSLRCDISGCGRPRAHHTTTHEMWDRRDAWAARHGYRLSSSPACPWAITRGRVPSGHWCGDSSRHPVLDIDVLDHGRVWIARDGSRRILAHVYDFDPADTLLVAQSWARSVGLTATLGDVADDWYCPGWAAPIWYSMTTIPTAAASAVR